MSDMIAHIADQFILCISSLHLGEISVRKMIREYNGYEGMAFICRRLLMQYMEGSDMTTQNTNWPNSRAQAITEMVGSVAKEQSALGRILESEANNLGTILCYHCVSPQQLLEANQSVYRLINAVSRLEMVLQSKLELFQDCLCPESSPLMCARED
ncbi:MAG: hypothetical protein GXY67_13075 [Clostridiales bacterium]|nr:hypothetical protein [Clostridiales bacterium]